VAKPEIATLRGPAEYSTREIERRNVYFETAGKSVDSPVVQRGSLLVDQAFEGPVIIEEHASTTVVQPGDRVRVERNGCLVIDIGADREGAVRT